MALALFAFLLVLFKDLNFQIKLKAPALDGVPVTTPYSPSVASPEVFAEEASHPGEPVPVREERFDLGALALPAEPERLARPEKKIPARTRIEWSAADREAFVKRFAHVAVGEKQKYGIPASLILANGLLVSQAGKQDLARRANNFFALPCTPSWRGDRLEYDGSCFRAYENAWTSFRDNSIYLTEGALSDLPPLESDDYRGWARALEAAGFYPEGVHARQVIDLIEKARLYLHDRN